ncbi:MAG: hypothetical protein UT41_C0002G0044 [Candidatus Wolfebacteria bacterium GW2011_GWC2_39_22]|uniref:Uncharacterized protein n=1 Tax=Candidatus Wolfebacteria bacterium GW2011_GWC2_39_22 TaxID=1619013 RepID=A0A0G0QPE6_9BACT|nr:MAG: hypothetical protein UT41_C0002G0044 [Candidatus Wolfebacteria bacterium GW2011_GWC2_39_22]
MLLFPLFDLIMPVSYTVLNEWQIPPHGDSNHHK